MGATRGDFVKYPRTPHLFGARGADDDKRLSDAASEAFLADDSLVVEEKVDGTNVGLHFTAAGEMRLQCRGHLITEGMHPQYDLFKQWAAVARPRLEAALEDRRILFGEWLYAKHSVAYAALPHYFLEFDVYDKADARFLTLDERLPIIEAAGVHTVPVLHRGAVSRSDLMRMIGPSRFAAAFTDPATGRTDGLMEGLYLRTEGTTGVTGRGKVVRPAFVEAIRRSTHWQSRAMVPNGLAEGAEIW